MKKRLVFLGPPGAGKGTQAIIISRKYSFERIATGDILREAIAEKSELGLRAKIFMDNGALVPDEVVNGILSARLKKTTNGFILDGYPRTKEQAEFIGSIADIELVIYFDAPEDLLVQRIINRRICPRCNAVYNLREFPPKVDNRCDLDGVELVHRSDDTEDVTRQRIRIFWQKTAPLVDYYFHMGLLTKISAWKGTADVTEEICIAIGASQR